MVYSKSKLFEQDLQQLAIVFKALAHPARLAILRYLAETQECITSDISNELPLSRTTVSQHLAELKKSGLIKGKVNGTKVNYCLDTSTIKVMLPLLKELLSEIDINFEKKCTPI